MECSTLNKVMLFENAGDNHFIDKAVNINEPDFLGEYSNRRVVIADTDQDGKQEHWQKDFGSGQTGGSESSDVRPKVRRRASRSIGKPAENHRKR